jgi:OOP family OmpA-OmpF porin
MFGRFVDWILAFVALIGIIVTGFWAVYYGDQSAVSLESDLQRQAANLLHENGYDWAEIALDGQHATLSGQSPGDGAGDGAIELLAASGVLGNDWSGPITSLSDEVIAGAPISPYIWSAEKTRSGGIILSGYAPERSIIETLAIDAEALAPGEVENFLKVGNGQPTGDWLMTAHKALLQLDNLEYGRVELIDNVLKIDGLSMSPAYRAKIRSGLQGLDGNYVLEADVRGAGIWSASLEAGRITLDGVVTSEAQRASILETVSEQFTGPVVDQMMIGTHTHDNWLAGVSAMLPQFLRFRSGFMSFDPEGDGYRIAGEASGSTIAYLREDTAEITAFPFVIDVRALETDVAEIEGLDFETDKLATCQGAFQAVLATNKINFESGADNIDRSSGNTLDKLMSVARRCDGLIFEIGGHTDSNGDRGYNISLSRSRAQAVADYMTARGIAADQLDAIGFGPDVPIADNGTREGRAANRRIEFKVVEGG